MLDKDLIHRVSEWNEARYHTPVFNLRLFKEMIAEEYDEYIWSYSDPVERLDALGDLLFITLGAYWKLSALPDKVLKTPYGANISNVVEPSEYLHYTVKTIISYDDGGYGIPHLLDFLLNAIICEFDLLGFVEQDVNDTLEAICDSNDTKEIVFLDEAEKGEMKHKGFVPPTETLKKIAARLVDESQKV